MNIFDTLTYLFLLGVCMSAVFVMIWIAVVLHVRNEKEEEDDI